MTTFCCGGAEVWLRVSEPPVVCGSQYHRSRQRQPELQEGNPLFSSDALFNDFIVN